MNKACTAMLASVSGRGRTKLKFILVNGMSLILNKQKRSVQGLCWLLGSKLDPKEPYLVLWLKLAQIQ